MPRPTRTIDFAPGATNEVQSARREELVAFMDVLGQAREGWVNLQPSADAEQEYTALRPSVLGGMLSGTVAQVTMGTWIPAKGGRRPGRVERLGLFHPTGRGAKARLAQKGLPVPAGWKVRQDHQRRGLILDVPVGTDHGQVLDWAVQAGTLLCPVPLTGRWRAVVYLPRPLPEPGS
jgi:hypothetical protein